MVQNFSSDGKIEVQKLKGNARQVLEDRRVFRIEAIVVVFDIGITRWDMGHLVHNGGVAESGADGNGEHYGENRGDDVILIFIKHNLFLRLNLSYTAKV